ncbi:leucine-rich repeat-containing protein 37B-like [Ochotona curzoniae]|uniref:leucine-rich repeat-containing protein 37B-like n=1 Tax=Ochotona curzoniae TaxID=130825 RepID=UPI001B351CB2|nr:leucine-rich repeat-containing protein 37B-like [Ochotona curzoniae]
MTQLCLWVPWLLFVWQPLWSTQTFFCQGLVQATKPWQTTQDPVQLTFDSSGLSESSVSHFSDHPPRSPDGLTGPADPGAFDYLASSTASPALILPKELTEGLVPFLDSNSAQELPPQPDHLEVMYQDLNDKQHWQQRLPNVVHMPDGDMPPRLRHKMETAGLDQAVDQSFETFVPTLDSLSSKATKLIVSPLKLKKDLAQHQQLAELAGMPGQSAKPQRPEPILQDDYEHPSVDTVYPGIKPLEFQVNPRELRESSEQMEPSQFQLEGHSFSLQQEAPAQHLQHLEKEYYPSTQEEAPPQKQQAPEEAKLSLTQRMASAQNQVVPQVGGQSSVHHEVNAPSQGPKEDLHSDLPSVTAKPADTELTVTPKGRKDAHPILNQHQTTAYTEGHHEEMKSSSSQSRALHATPQVPELVRSSTQSAGQVEVLKSLLEKIAPTPLGFEAQVQPQSQDQTHYHVPNVTFKPTDMGVPITSETTKKVESSSTKKVILAQILQVTMEGKPSPSKGKVLEHYAESPKQANLLDK